MFSDSEGQKPRHQLYFFVGITPHLRSSATAAFQVAEAYKEAVIEQQREIAG